MPSYLEALYGHLPLLLQDALVTIANTRTLYRKYGTIGRDWAVLPSEDRQPHSPQTRLLQLLRYATEHSEFYADRIGEVRNAQEVDVEDTLKKIPITQKQVFRENLVRIMSDEVTANNSIQFRTSGTTGTPLIGAISRSDYRARFAALCSWYKTLGISLRMRWARFSGVDIAKTTDSRWWRYDFARRHMFLSVYHLQERTASKYAKAMREFHPEVIEGYPSAIATLARLIRAQGLRAPDPKFVITTAETLDEPSREVIAEVFGVSPLEYYGSAEMSPLMVASRNSGLSLVSDTGIVELLDKENHPVHQKGGVGRMVVTSFNSFFTPLIRYDIGDLAEYDSGSCTALRVKKILGRVEQVARGVDGQLVGRLSTALKYLPSTIHESQLRVRTEAVTLRYVAETNAEGSDLKEFERAVRAKLGSVQISYERVEEIELSGRGKKLAVIVED